MTATKANLTDFERERVLQHLSQHYSGGKLKKGETSENAEKFNACRQPISSTWNRAENCMQSGEIDLPAVQQE